MKDVLSPEEWYDLNQFTLELTNSKAPVLSLYIPFYEIVDIPKVLNEITGDALVHVKKTVADKIHKIRCNSGTLCIFGWTDNRSIVKHVIVTKEMPPFHVIHKNPYLKPLKDILEIGYQIIVIIMDHRHARIEVFNGSELVEEISIRSHIMGRHSKGGWSQKRFQQNRELKIKYFFRRVSQLLERFDDIDLVLLGGNGVAKKKFATILDERMKQKTHEVEGISFKTSKNKITEHVITLLDKARKKTELGLLKKLTEPAKEGLVIADNKLIERKIKEGAVDTLFLAADYHTRSPKENSIFRRVIKAGKRNGTMIEFITEPDARKRLHKFGNLVALLRYR